MSTKSIAAVLALAGLMAAQAPYQTTEYLGGEFADMTGWSTTSFLNGLPQAPEMTIEQASVDGMTTSGALTLRPAGRLVNLSRWTGTLMQTVPLPANVRVVARVDFAIQRGTGPAFADPVFQVTFNGWTRLLLHRPDASVDYAPGTWVRGSAMVDVGGMMTPRAILTVIEGQTFDPTMTLRIDHLRIYTAAEMHGTVSAGAARPGELLRVQANAIRIFTAGVADGLPMLLASAPGAALQVPGVAGALMLDPAGLVVLQSTLRGDYLDSPLQVPALPGLVGMRLALQAAQLGAAPYLGEPRVVPVDGGL